MEGSAGSWWNKISFLTESCLSLHGLKDLFRLHKYDDKVVLER